jgi:hypothetical protein
MRKIISGFSIARPRTGFGLGFKAAALFGAACAVGALSGAAPAAANPAEDRIIAGFCEKHPQTDECHAWQLRGGEWGEDQYQAFYNTHIGTEEFSTPEAKQAFGRADSDIVPGAEGVGGDADAAAPDLSQTNSRAESGANQPPKAAPYDPAQGGEVIGDSPNHVADCQASFKSYNPATDTYVGLDGQVKKCKL